jgi:hypothetical protein
MHRSLRRSRITAAAAAGALAVSLTATAYVETSAAVPAGPSGPAIVLEDQVSLSGGVDAATDPSTDISYVGWISDNATNPQLREVHLCVLPIEAKGCAGGVLTASAIDGASAAGLQVEVTAPGVVTLVWFHQSGLTTGMLATATYANGVLAPSVDVAAAPSNGVLFDVVPGPDGQLWALTGNDSGTGQNLQVRAGLAGAPQPLTAPWLVGQASLAFAGSKPIVIASQAGSISGAVHYSSGLPFTAFQPIGKTWSLGVFSDVVGTKKGVRMIGSEDNANYRPVVARWTSSGFSQPRLIGENQACPALTFDLVTDGSGRLANVSERCGKLGVYNLPDTKNAAIVRFGSGGTIAGAPQITTTTRGYGWVAWAILGPIQGEKLFVRPVRLPALMKQKSAQEKGNKVTVSGPASCLPVVTVKGKLKTNPAKGWDLVSRQLKLDGDNVDSPVKIDGEKLAAGSKHVLLGKGVFKKGNQTVTVTKKFRFKAC